MPEGNPQRSDIDEAREQLDEGLKSCRSVVDNYRLMLTLDSSALKPANDEPGLTGPADADS